MLKKMTALLLVLAFSQAYAGVAPVQHANDFSSELNRSFDDLSFKINVQWDQKDSKFFEQSITNFEDKIAELQKEGLTSDDLVKHALGKIKDQRVLSDIGRMARVIDDMSPDEARSFVVSNLNKTYSHGASWSSHGSDAKIYAVTAIICVLIWVSSTHKSHRDITITYPQLIP